MRRRGRFCSSAPLASLIDLPRRVRRGGFETLRVHPRRTWLGLRAGKSQLFVFRPEDIAVETVDPLAPTCGHIEVADRLTDVGRDFLPVELRIFVDPVRRRCIAKLAIQADFLEFVV